ncbi:peptidoglycan editing factor PgeF [Candidatus Woesebacteria bacterium]|nr:peptidoglycan editing factor PgeF [Candidatus Woesebacteria bacterium]
MNTSTLLRKIPHGFGTKADGDGRNPETLHHILQEDGISYKRIIKPRQTHGTHVEIVSVASSENPMADGLVTKSSEVVLTVLTADCVPIMYYDPKSSVIGISHGGWKGTLDKIPQKVIESMQSLGSKVQNIRVSIGPSIGSCCYEIYGERKTLFLERFSSAVFAEKSDNTYLDLQDANRESLLETGILPQNIELITTCTSCSDASFFSFHRDKCIRGEMTSFISLD